MCAGPSVRPARDLPTAPRPPANPLESSGESRVEQAPSATPAAGTNVQARPIARPVPRLKAARRLSRDRVEDFRSSRSESYAAPESQAFQVAFESDVAG